MGKVELMQEAFGAINAYKRHRALHQLKTQPADKQFHELEMYKTIDQLELALRGIQASIRNEEAKKEVATT